MKEAAKAGGYALHEMPRGPVFTTGSRYVISIGDKCNESPMVCRGTDLSRTCYTNAWGCQQFDGQQLTNPLCGAQAYQKCCQYFQVTEYEVFEIDS